MEVIYDFSKVCEFLLEDIRFIIGVMSYYIIRIEVLFFEYLYVELGIV